MRFTIFGLAVLATVTAQTPPGKIKPGDWPSYTGDLAGTRYSSLRQISTANVAKLEQAWSFSMKDATPPPPPTPQTAENPFPAAAGGGGVNPEATPIMVDGRMYLPAGRRVVALDPVTGKQVWIGELPFASIARGLAYWPGDGNNPPRILVTAAKSLVALNARTGRVDPGFGKEGIVDIGVPWSGAPAVFKNLIMLGATVGEIPIGPPGDSRAYDARTGAKLWEFHSVPRPGEPGFGGWEGDSWKGFSGVNVWAWYLTVDQQRGIVYMPFGSPAGNYYGGDRPGNNLFGNSLVAMDANTGKYLWHFQTVHHDIWDLDLPPAPTLIDITHNGKKIPALAIVGKSGWMFLLNRVTGEPVFGVEERPVPKGDVPGEWYAPTQPFPVLPPPLVRTKFDMADLVTAQDTTPEHAQACRDLVERSGGLSNAGPFTPFLFHAPGTPAKSTLTFPGNGGANWGGTAADPKSGYVYVQTHDIGLVGWMEEKDPKGNYGSGNGSPQKYDRGSVDGPGPYHSFAVPMKDAEGKSIGNWPCQKPPWARLWAVNANTGQIAWQVPLGITEALPEGKRNTGGSGSAGPIVTAGGLVFIGATQDSRFRAFDSHTGNELWVTKLERNVNANPITYEGSDGNQYVAVIATNQVVAFRLPAGALRKP